MGTACGSCHIGGSLVEADRNGVRHSQRPMDLSGGTFNAYDNYVQERYNSTTGLPEHFNNPFDPSAGTAPGFGVAYATWAMPGTFDNQPTASDGSNAIVPGDWVTDAQGWAPAEMVGMGMAVDGQMMMPNVREMDCFYCHLEGYNNIVSSVAVQMGYFNAAPSLASGMMNMFSQRYNPGTYITGDPIPGFEAFGEPASLSGDVIGRLKAEPPAENCRQCHTPTTMADFSDMFDKFLAAAPMSYEPGGPNSSLINGMAMPTYDLNAAFVPYNSTSPNVNFDVTNPGWWIYDDGSAANGPFGIFPMALDSDWSMLNSDGTYNSISVAGGGKPGGTGPLYYGGATTNDQNALKKATIPFPRADFFKRGDTWDGTEQDVHYNIGCKGCHFNTETLNTDLNQCDPGRGHTRMGGIESGKFEIDTRDTVKRCQDCHVRDANIDNVAIQTYNAPDPDAAHRRAGLLEGVVQVVDQNNNPISGGTHIDAIDCSVCHIYKKSMAVRALDSTSGNRYPTLIGFEGDTKGMMAMFTDPMPDGSMKNEYKQWQPLYGWHANHPTDDSEGRRKIIPINMITAQMWDDSATDTVDANGDGGEGKQDVQWDPWIMRDMKTGMNFAAGPFGTIPVGFGNAGDGVTGGAYQSAFNADMTFTGAFDWVGVYGGNAILTKPDHISTYKAYRNAIAGSNGVPNKSWSDTELVFFGGNPFQVTHNVVPTNKYVLGSQCSDCHSPNSGFFSGGYDMTGSAVPATADFPEGSGTYSTMMERPVIDYEVTALASDLRTGSEAKSKKDGLVLDVEFDTVGCWDSANEAFTPEGETGCAVGTGTHRQTHDLERSKFLYPVPHDSDFATYYAMTDYTGTTNYNTLDGWVTYLESIGKAPTADISTVEGSSTDPVTLTLYNTVQLEAVQSDGSYTYTWSCTDGGADVTGASTTRTFDVAGTYSLRLAVENNNTGEVATDYVEVKVEAAEVGSTGLTIGNTVSTTDGVTTISVDATPSGTSRLTVIWGDGGRDVYDSVPTSVSHEYYGSKESYTAEFRAINATTGELLAKNTVTVSGYPGGGEPVTQTVAITEPAEGSVTNIDQIRLIGTRSAGTNIVVTADSTNVSIGSVYYVDGDWYCDVYYTAADTVTFTATTDDGSASDTVTVEYRPLDSSTLGVPFNITYNVLDSAAGSVLVKGSYSGGYNGVVLIPNYPSDATVGDVLYNSASADGTGFKVQVDGLYNALTPNYATAKEVDVAGNEGEGNYFEITFE